MGMHEWLIKKGYRYEVTPELHQWLGIYKGISDSVSRDFADAMSVSRPVANRAIAPTGSIGIWLGLPLVLSLYLLFRTSDGI